MARARNLLLALEEESLGILEEVHGEEWHPHRWIHLICPTGEFSASDPALGITHRSVQAFLNADSFAWREVLERVVGKSEASPGGLAGRFPPIMLARIDSFVGLFAQGVKGVQGPKAKRPEWRRPDWIIRVLARIRRLRNLPADVQVPGPLPRISRASRRQREADRFARGVSAAPARVPSMVLEDPLPRIEGVGLGGAVVGGLSISEGRHLQAISELEGAGTATPLTVSVTTAMVAARPLTPPPRLHRVHMPKRAGYLRSKGGNSAIFGMLDRTVSLANAPKSFPPVGRLSLMEEDTSFFG